MKLSEHFTLEELTASESAARHGIDNTPTPAIAENLRSLAAKLEEVRALLGRPVTVLSGYRSPALNKAVKGSRTSAHMEGLAADIIAPGYGKTMDVFERLRSSGIVFDQLIAEFPASPSGGWVHIGMSKRPRREALVFDGRAYSVIV